MAETYPDGSPAKSGRRKELAEFLGDLQVNFRHPQL
jgi:hypothetical protein